VIADLQLLLSRGARGARAAFGGGEGEAGDISLHPRPSACAIVANSAGQFVSGG